MLSTRSKLGALRAMVVSTGLLLSAAAWAAVPSLVGYPAPGGNDASSVGTGPADAGGIVWTYEHFHPDHYDKLYYGIGNYVGGSFVPGWPTLTFDGTPDVLLFNAAASDLPLGIAVFSGTSIVYTVPAPQIAYTRLTVVVTNADFLPTALLDPTTLGMPGELGGVLDVAGTYHARWSFEATFNPASGYVAANDFFTAVPDKTPGFQAQSSVGGAFYATPVPEPAAAAMLLAGLIAVGWLRLRRN